MPWQYMEFAQVFNGIQIPGNEFEEGVGRFQSDDSGTENNLLQLIFVAKEDSGSAAWVIVLTDGEYSQVMFDCDKASENFGSLYHWNINEGCDIGLLAPSLLHLIKKLYIK